jgi:hypothetical protein
LSVERYFKVADLAARLDVSPKVIRAALARGEFSPPSAATAPGPDCSNIIDLGSDVRVPLSGVLFFLASRRWASLPRSCAAVAGMVSEPRVFFAEPVLDEPIAARSVGELRRKAAHG